MGATNTLGQQGEDLALNFLQKNGLTLIQRNYRSRYGEIDLGMQDKEHVAFVEVRLRTSESFGGALFSIDRRKQSKLIKCAQQYIANESSRLDFRFDAIPISPVINQHDIQWIINAFDEF